MRPFLERLAVEADASWSLLNRRLDDAIPFEWHHHPEFELTLTLNSRGQRFVGDHVGSYGDADLALIGPNLPHTWSSDAKINPARPHAALVFWFRHDWIEPLLGSAVEFRAVRSLLGRAGAGLSFAPDTGLAVRAQCETLFDLAPPGRLIGLLQVLSAIAARDPGIALASTARGAASAQDGRERIDRVLTHIHASYTRSLRLDDLAAIAALSASGLHRMFLRHTGATVSDYVGKLRVGEACARLSGTEAPVRHIAEAVGFASLANFNRQFRRARAMTPRQYRERFRPGRPRPAAREP